MRIVSWNVNGWRAIERKGALEWVNQDQADVYCFQEIKTQNPELPIWLAADYEAKWSAAEKKGYSGTMIVAKKSVLEQAKFWEKLPAKIQADEQLINAEGRICVLSWPAEKRLLINCYFPNGGMSEQRLQYKMDFYAAFERVVNDLRADWPEIIVCGDVNTAHQEIDLARPKANEKNTGFLPMERAWIDEFLASGWVDTWRYFYPEQKDAYTWWDYKTRARERNVGWRIDYFLVTKILTKKLAAASIKAEITGSDHAPIELGLAD